MTWITPCLSHLHRSLSRPTWPRNGMIQIPIHWLHRFICGGGTGNCGSNHQVTILSAAAIALQLQPPASRRSADSSPSHSHTHSHSQMSRNSSRKSNNSVNCKLDGKDKLPASVSSADDDDSRESYFCRRLPSFWLNGVYSDKLLLFCFGLRAYIPFVSFVVLIRPPLYFIAF